MSTCRFNTFQTKFNSEECIICLMDYEEDSNKLYCSECNTSVHPNCYRQMRNKKCPQCRRTVISADLSSTNKIQMNLYKEGAYYEKHSRMMDCVNIKYIAYLPFSCDYMEEEAIEWGGNELGETVGILYEGSATTQMVNKFKESKGERVLYNNEYDNPEHRVYITPRITKGFLRMEITGRRWLGKCFKGDEIIFKITETDDYYKDHYF